MKIESTVFTNRNFMDLTQEEVHRLSAEQSGILTSVALDAGGNIVQVERF